MNQNQHQSISSNLIWRPPYPSENLKTPRLQQQSQQQPPTYSTTNPYAEPEHPQSQQQQPQQPQQEQEQPFQIQQSIAHNDLQHSKRENNSNKIYERGLTPQVGMNPFLKDSNYLQDLETQNEFLKPMNSNM
jgi:hypothetical protein